VPGIGAKTAASLLAGGLRLEDLPDSGRLDSHRGGRAAQECWPQVLAWRDMIRLATDLSLPVKPTGQPTAPLPRPADVLQQLDLW
jgi:DNA polymerase-1